MTQTTRRNFLAGVAAVAASPVFFSVTQVSSGAAPIAAGEAIYVGDPVVLSNGVFVRARMDKINPLVGIATNNATRGDVVNFADIEFIIQHE